MNKKKILNLLLLLTSLIGYLEWGSNHAFIFQIEFNLFSGEGHAGESFMHPFILIPLIGQVLMVITLFQKQPSKKLTMTGLSFLSLIMVFLFLIGILVFDKKIILSTLPFLATGIAIMRIHRKSRPV